MNLRVLGGLRLEVVQLERPKPLLLLAYLALEGPRSRSDLSGLFFPESVDRADALSTTLRRLWSHGVILERDGKLSVQLKCDALEFRTLRHAGHHLQAADAYTGAFLSGFALPLHPELEDWLLETREALASEARESMLVLAEHGFANGDDQEVNRCAEVALTLEGAPPLEPEDLARWHAVLVHSGSPLRAKLRADAASLGLTLAEITEQTTNLPVLLTAFVGREPERLEIAGVLGRREGRLITVHGPGGIGKTRLAIQVGAEALEHRAFPDGVFFIALDGLEQAWQFPSTVGMALGVPSSGNEPMRVIAEGIGQKRSLAILDNFEHLAECAPLLTPLLTACPNLALLVTSRARLNLQAEWVISLEGLTLPSKGAPLEVMLGSDAIRLFLERIQHARLGMALDDQSLQSAWRVCEIVSGYPLGIELAAAWVKSMSLKELVLMLETEAVRLETPHQDVHDRHRSVRAAFERSWWLLESGPREVLRRLAVFSGGFTPDAAFQVAGASRETLVELADRSLVQISEAGRYSFHSLLQQYVHAKLEEQPDTLSSSEERHAHFYAQQLEGINIRANGGTSLELREFMLQNESNVLTLVRWALRKNQYAMLDSLSEPLLWQVPATGRIREAMQLFEEISRQLPESDPEAALARLAYTTNLAWNHLFMGQIDEALRLGQRATELALQSGHAFHLMRAMDCFGQIHSRAGNYADACPLIAQAVTIARTFGDDVRLLRTLSSQLLAHTLNDDLEHAQHALNEARALYKSGKVAPGLDVIWLLTYEGVFRLMAGHTDLALETWVEGRQVIASVPGTQGLATVILALSAFAHLERGLDADVDDLAQCESLCNEALPLARATGEMFAQTLVLAVQGRLALERGVVNEAVRLLQQSVNAAWTSRNLITFSWALPYLAETMAAAGDQEQAAELLGFLLASSNTGSWMHARAAKARHSLARFDPKRIADGLERGSGLSMDELAFRIFGSAIQIGN